MKQKEFMILKEGFENYLKFGHFESNESVDELVLKEDLNEGLFGDFVDSFGQKDYKNYKMMLQLCDKLIENIKKDNRFHDEHLYIDEKSMENVISGELKIRASSDRSVGYVRTDPLNNNHEIRNISYTYNVTSEIGKDIRDIMLTFKSEYGGYADFVVNVPLESGKNRYLNRPDFELEEVKNIGDHIHKEFLSAMNKREEERERNRQETADREAGKAERAKKLGISRER